jgi:hypothetical protein
VKDNAATSGGTSFALYDMFLNGTMISDADAEETTTYDDVLDMYYRSIECHWSNRDGEGFDDIADPDNACYILPHFKKNASLAEVGYALIDVNNDRSPELFISLMEETASGGFYDMYTIVDGVVVHAVTAGERDRYSLAVDYSINNVGSGSALTSSQVNYRLDKVSGSLKVNQAIIYDGYRDEKNPYFYATTDYYDDIQGINEDLLEPISSERAKAILAGFPENIKLDMIPFSEYTPGASTSEDKKSAVYDAYMEVLQQSSGEYMLYDIDENGVSELIVRSQGCSVYTFDGSKAVLCGTCYPYYNGLYAFDGNGIIVHDGGMGSLHFEYVTLYKLQGNRLEEQLLISTEEASYDDIEEYLSQYSNIADFRETSDSSLLEQHLP